MTYRLLPILLCSVAAVGLIWATEIPLGVPNEWTWNRIRHESPIESLLGIVPVALAGTLYFAVARWGFRRIDKASRSTTCGVLTLLMMAAFVWLLAVQDAPPEGHRLSKAPWILYYPSMTGYYHKARYEITDSAQFLKSYEQLMSEGDVLHVGTHPPGLFLLNRAIFQSLNESPNAVAVLNGLQPESFRQGFDVLSEQAALRPNWRVTETDRAALWLATLLSHASVCWVLVPLFAILSWCESRTTSWQVICFWPLVPTVSIFLPKDDVLFSGLVMTFLWSWLKAVREAESSKSKSFGWGALAGTLGFVGLCLSLVFLPIGLIAVLVSVAMNVQKAQSASTEVPSTPISKRVIEAARQLLIPSLGGLLAIVVGLACAHFACDLNLIAVWKWNLRNHEAFYGQYPRTIWKWWFVNILELVLSIGVPIAVLIVTGLLRMLAQRPIGAPSLRIASSLGVTAVWGFLWLSGKNSGEAARLWIPLLPLAIWLMPAAFDVGQITSQASSESASHDERYWLGVLVIQQVVCFMTVIRVTGFHFGG